VTQPKLILADEPTGNLDQKTGESIYQLLSDLREQMHTSFVVVTHDTQLAKRLDRSLNLIDGRLSDASTETINALTNDKKGTA
jgi:lipoprotein-releasing system ATP-binding protein